ncbi:hypothetical protein NM208_g5432 [Fusarium decemcellulare]|uniref:Uncharacterized protein n=1 Tax=Fusarium decemcellulare TaxID=57161 RepID=A0ACC1SH13_9HYPO|nr:hypothetical protein NM208_g5432 [Fusarium decemcellulare]
MAGKASKTEAQSFASFHFPNSHTALEFFNNDRVSGPDYAMASDDGYVLDDEDFSQDISIPSSYLSSFSIRMASASSHSLAKTPTLGSNSIQKSSKTAPRKPGAELHLPAYYVHQIDWQHPVNIRELAKCSKQHKYEVDALFWDTNHPFEPSSEAGCEEYKKERAEWRALRLKCIYRERSDKEQTRDQKILSRIDEIADRREQRRQQGESTEPE